MLDGESPTSLASELKVLRKMLYRWKDAYLSGGAAALRPLGRPRKNQSLLQPPVPTTERGELPYKHFYLEGQGKTRRKQGVERETGLAGIGREIERHEDSIWPLQFLPGLFPRRADGDCAGLQTHVG